jgi:hypothetical protein
MSWILREGGGNLTVMVCFTVLIIELCPDEGKPTFWQVLRLSADPQRNAICLDHLFSQLDVHYQAPLFSTTSPIEYL